MDSSFGKSQETKKETNIWFQNIKSGLWDTTMKNWLCREGIIHI